MDQILTKKRKPRGGNPRVRSREAETCAGTGLYSTWRWLRDWGRGHILLPGRVGDRGGNSGERERSGRRKERGRERILILMYMLAHGLEAPLDHCCDVA